MGNCVVDAVVGIAVVAGVETVAVFRFVPAPFEVDIVAWGFGDGWGMECAAKS